MGTSTVLPILGALGCAVCYGTGSILQAASARKLRAGDGLDPRLLGRALRQVPYLIGLGLDALGFLLSLAALRALPLFVVEAAVASNVAVIAVLSVPFLGERLRRIDWVAVVAVVGGLALLAVSAEAGPAQVVPGWLRWGVLVLAGVALAAGVPAARLPGAAAPAVLGALAGLGWAAVGIGARIVRDPHSVSGLLHDPATYAVIVGGVGGLLLYTTALQRGSVTRATAAVVVVETAVPALVGLVWLGDRARDGWAAGAVAGFLLAVVGALTLAGVEGRLETPVDSEA